MLPLELEEELLELEELFELELLDEELDELEFGSGCGSPPPPQALSTALARAVANARRAALSHGLLVADLHRAVRLAVIPLPLDSFYWSCASVPTDAATNHTRFAADEALSESQLKHTVMAVKKVLLGL